MKHIPKSTKIIMTMIINIINMSNTTMILIEVINQIIEIIPIEIIIQIIVIIITITIPAPIIIKTVIITIQRVITVNRIDTITKTITTIINIETIIITAAITAMITPKKIIMIIESFFHPTFICCVEVPGNNHQSFRVAPPPVCICFNPSCLAAYCNVRI